jgi:hypothetical protein
MAELAVDTAAQRSLLGVTVASDENNDYRLNEQVGFLLRVAMQRHTAIFMSASATG